MNKIYILALLATVLFTLCQAQSSKAKIAYISPEQIKSIGESVKLDCVIDNVNFVPIIWKKKNRDRLTEQTVLTINREKVVQDPRFTLTFTNNTADKTLNVSLAITDIKQSDSGIYECILEALEPKDKVLQNVELQVRTPPKILEKLSTTHIQTEVGSEVTLRCTAEGYPRPTITWTRQNNAILPEGGKTFVGPELRIKNVSSVDRGLYYCTAANEVGEPAQQTVSLEVDFAPIISVYRPKVAQAHGYSIDLECNIQSHPAPQIEWTKNGKKIQNDDEHQVSQIGTINDLTVTKVKIVSVEKHNYGDYQCKATNKLGSAQAKLNLYKQLLPNINHSGLTWVEGASFSVGVSLGSSISVFAILIPIILLSIN